MRFFGRRLILNTANLIAALALCACGADGSSGSGDEQNVPDSSILIKNLNITINKSDGDSILTFSLENKTSKSIAQCSSGKIVTSTGDDAVVSFTGGGCNGFIGPNASVEEDYCANSVLRTVCDSGLVGGNSTGIIELRGSTYGTTLDPWEVPGTTYTLDLTFLMEDAELVTTTAKTTVK